MVKIGYLRWVARPPSSVCSGLPTTMEILGEQPSRLPPAPEDPLCIISAVYSISPQRCPATVAHALLVCLLPLETCHSPISRGRPSLKPSPRPSLKPSPSPSLRPSPTSSLRPSPKPSLRPSLRSDPRSSLRPSSLLPPPCYLPSIPSIAHLCIICCK